MLCFPFWFFKVQISYGAHENMWFRTRTLLCAGWALRDEWKEKTAYKEQSRLLGEHRPFAPRDPGKDSQKESEQAALYFANGWVRNSWKQENLSYSLDSEKKWPGDLWHLWPPGLSPRPSALTSEHSNILKPGPARARTANYLWDGDKHLRGHCFAGCGLRTTCIRITWAPGITEPDGDGARGFTFWTHWPNTVRIVKFETACTSVHLEMIRVHLTKFLQWVPFSETYLFNCGSLSINPSVNQKGKKKNSSCPLHFSLHLFTEGV